MSPPAVRGWTERKLGEASNILDNLRVPLSGAQRADRAGPFPYCGANGVLDHIDDYMIDDDVILLAEDGGNFDQWRTRPIAYRMKGKIWVNNHAHVLKAANGGDTVFLFYALEHKDITPYISSGTRSKLTRGELVRIKVSLPDDIEEQRSIARSLEDSDELILGLERIIAKKQAIKQGMMQELLTGKTRLPGFTCPWVGMAIGDLAQVTGGGTPSTRVANLWGGGIPWFTPAEIPQSGAGIVTASERTISEAGLHNSAAKLLPEGSVLVTSRASIGNTAIAGCPVATNQGFTSLVPKDRRSTEFLYYWVQQHRSRLTSRAAGSTFLEISASKVSSIEILTPDAPERAAIGSVLMDADAELQSLHLRLKKVREIKRGMMQELLSGRTRLPVDEGAS